MPSGLVRDVADLEPGVLAWMRHRHPERGGLRIDSLRHASAGLSNETVLVHAGWDDDTEPTTESLALRLPALQMTFPDFDLRAQARVQRAVAAGGVPTPAPVALEEDQRWLGTPFLAMPFVAGQVGPQAPAFDPWLLGLRADQQRGVADRFLDLLASLHQVDPTGGGLPPLLRGADATVAEEVEWWSAYVGWACEGDDVPTAVTELLAWCRTTCPAAAPPASLLWGDPRLGNAIFDADQQIVAALDWDMAFVGPAEHDLAWYLGLDEVGAALAGRRVPGFPSRGDAIARYEDRVGRRLVDFDWYEVFALVRSIAVAVRQSRLAAAAGVNYPVPAPEHNPVIPYVRELITRLG
jgi:aminoglycoside phosphotransferase (APT) family kinase protein